MERTIDTHFKMGWCPVEEATRVSPVDWEKVRACRHMRNTRVRHRRPSAGPRREARMRLRYLGIRYQYDPTQTPAIYVHTGPSTLRKDCRLWARRRFGRRVA
jgi:hypothetical protein